MANGADHGLDGRVALVTGGGRGIGRGIATQLVAGGAAVVVTYVRDEESATAFVDEVRAGGGRALAVRADIRDPQASVEAVGQAAAAYGLLDIVVSNAGIASRGLPVAETTPDELDRVLRVHAMGPHFLAQAALPHLRRHERSDVVFVSSIAARRFSARSAPYSMGKAAVEALAHTLAMEERAAGVRVNIVAPGLVDTEMGRRLARATADVTEIRELDASSPFGHVCSPDEIGSVVRFLVSPAASYVNDQRIAVDGGTF